MLKIEQGKRNTILRTISSKITKDELKNNIKLGKEMLKYIKDPDNGGVGLAAPQVGYNKRLIVVSLLKDREDESFPTIMMINPEILEHSKEKQISEEGCLSLPEETGKVPRFKEIKLKYFDEKLNEKIIKLNGLRSNIIQHEIDHLDGILFTDRIEESKNTKNLKF
ncbi:MAG: peptide deformylase [Candidatus Gracilibacteria bacterium]|nr:peptide deformylase [Candidatus Gracilibacteria bacterium]MDQ7023307.1 peptide deformylase [Candidatus Gracilibacteria bacterium]